MNNIVLYIYSKLDLFNEIEKIFYGIIQDVSLYIIIIIIVWMKAEIISFQIKLLREIQFNIICFFTNNT